VVGPELLARMCHGAGGARALPLVPAGRLSVVAGAT